MKLAVFPWSFLRIIDEWCVGGMDEKPGEVAADVIDEHSLTFIVFCQKVDAAFRVPAR